jgi:hypothetical protein
MALMPEIIMSKGVAIVTFQSEAEARDWSRTSKLKGITFFRQTTTEEEVQINI